MRWQSILCWTLAALCALWVVVRFFGLERGFPAVPLIAFTPQMVLAALMVAGVSLGLREWPAALTAAAAAVALALMVLPRTQDHSDPAALGETLRVLAVNGKRGQADAKDIIGEVRQRDVDLLSVEELTPELATKLEGSGLGELLPDEALTPRADAFGSGLYARFPLTPGGAGDLERAQQRATGRPPGAVPVEIVAVHPQSPVSLPGVGAWDRGLDDLPRADPEGPFRLLLGDFNATLDHDKLRDLLDSGYTDAGAETGNGLAGTFPGDSFGVPPMIAIDHVLIDERAAVRHYDVVSVEGTDHRAVYAELALPHAVDGPGGGVVSEG